MMLPRLMNILNIPLTTIRLSMIGFLVSLCSLLFFLMICLKIFVYIDHVETTWHSLGTCGMFHFSIERVCVS